MSASRHQRLLLGAQLSLELALEKTGGNITRAAKLAGVGRRFFQKAMQCHGLRGRA